VHKAALHNEVSNWAETDVPWLQQRLNTHSCQHSQPRLTVRIPGTRFALYVHDKAVVTQLRSLQQPPP
jgi:hypothetical protein